MSFVEENLPIGWTRATLGDLLDRLQYGYTAKAETKVDGPRFLRITDIREDGVNWDTVPGCHLPDSDFEKYRLENGDLVFARSGSIEKAWRVKGAPDAVFASYLIRGKPIIPHVGGWLEYFVKSRNYLKQIGAASAGIGMQNVNAQRLAKVSLPLAPMNEQHRVIAKLEELFAKVDACRKRLEQVPRLLKQFRQSILVAACSGKLTVDWREVNKPGPAASLLEAILKERRKKWESDQLEKMVSSGKKPTDDKWKDKYVEPVTSDPSNLEKLPDGWTWGTWNQISNWVTYGFTRPMPHVEIGIPIITAKHVVNGKVHTTGTDVTTEEAYKELSEKDRPQPGDILVTKDGSIGRCAIVEPEEAFCINQSVAVVWLRSLSLERKYLLYVIESPFTQKRVVERARGNAIQHLSITDFAATPLPIPSRDEQVEIIRRVEALFKIADSVEDRYRKAHDQLDKLPQAILGKAFRGELVPQDPYDEPASLLLDRLIGGHPIASNYSTSQKFATRAQTRKLGTNGKLKPFTDPRPPDHDG